MAIGGLVFQHTQRDYTRKAHLQSRSGHRAHTEARYATGNSGASYSDDTSSRATNSEPLPTHVEAALGLLVQYHSNADRQDDHTLTLGYRALGNAGYAQAEPEMLHELVLPALNGEWGASPIVVAEATQSLSKVPAERFTPQLRQALSNVFFDFVSTTKYNTKSRGGEAKSTQHYVSRHPMSVRVAAFKLLMDKHPDEEEIRSFVGVLLREDEDSQIKGFVYSHLRTLSVPHAHHTAVQKHRQMMTLGALRFVSS